ncbi:30S ribosomal protein S9 [Candidatus Uhrbacteria bacterium]|nr:30S ribosomal protein S9 [Candidatus Uhrbacteria bacterium]
MTEEKKISKPASRKRTPYKTTGVKRLKRTEKKKEKAAEVELTKTEVGEEKKSEYLSATGRRKEAVALVRLFRRGSGKMTVNDKEYQIYFPRYDLRETMIAPLRAVGQQDLLDVWARVRGGGMRGQAEAIRLGIARALLKQNPTFRISLKRLDFLRRDPREKERKKYGLKKARRAPQWAKR